MGKHKHDDVRRYFLNKKQPPKCTHASFGCQFCGKSYIMNVTRMRLHLGTCVKCPDSIRKKFKTTTTPTRTSTPFERRESMQRVLSTSSEEEEIQSDSMDVDSRSVISLDSENNSYNPTHNP